MKYLCLENKTVISILAYEPTVPDSVTVIPITDDQYQKLEDRSAWFDIDSKSIVDHDDSHFQTREILKNNAAEREFLNSTDWMILRHLRQKVLNIETSLTEIEYTDLERQRHDAANRVVQINNDN